jgi:hypothetical protein
VPKIIRPIDLAFDNSGKTENCEVNKIYKKKIRKQITAIDLVTIFMLTKNLNEKYIEKNNDTTVSKRSSLTIKFGDATL